MRKIPVLTAAILASVTATVAMAQGSPPAPAAPGPAAQARTAAPRPDLTRAAVEQQSKATFARMDANRDGVLNAADDDARRQARFDQLDTDRNGAISREEFAAGNRPQRQAGAQGASARAITADQFTAAALSRFDAADQNKDGTLSTDERRAAAGQRPPRQG